ncbi:MAG TPA: hypothetical protein VEL12_02740 [Candidatus Nitrosopolaris sp.]|nr:hypothetical protein [Candidatus Nitrosopolaris sp.]
MAVYWADLYKDHPEHPEPRAVLTVALGDDWSDTADPSGHAWVELNVWPSDNEIRMSFMDVEGDLDAAHFGLPLNREAALACPDKDAFLTAADEIVFQDERVAVLLGARR